MQSNSGTITPSLAKAANLKGLPTVQQVLTNIDNGDMDEISVNAIMGKYSAPDQVAIQRALRIHASRRAFAPDEIAEEESSADLKKFIFFENEPDESNASSEAKLKGKGWHRTRTILGLGLMVRGVRMAGAGLREEPKVKNIKAAETEAAEAARAEHALTDATRAEEFAKETRIAGEATRMADMSRLTEASRLSRVFKAGGLVGFVASLVALPMAAKAAVMATAPKGEDSATTEKISNNAAVRVGLVDKNAQQDWMQGNRGKAIGEETIRTASDTIGFLKRAFTDPKKALREAEETVIDIAKLGKDIIEHPRAVAAGIRALGEAGSDAAIIRNTRGAATAGDPAQARAAALQALRAVQSNQGVMQSVQTVVSGKKSFADAAHGTIVANQTQPEAQPEAV